jgi:predicted nucleic acid-binding protein
VIYLDACALVKFIKPEIESEALRSWRAALPPDTVLVSSELSRLEITRALRRAGVEPEQVPYYAGQALRGVYVLDVTTTVLARAAAYRTARLGSLDAIHLASADPLRPDMSALVTYDQELAHAAVEVGFAVDAPA